MRLQEYVTVSVNGLRRVIEPHAWLSTLHESPVEGTTGGLGIRLRYLVGKGWEDRVTEFCHEARMLTKATLGEPLNSIFFCAETRGNVMTMLRLVKRQ